MRVLWRVDDASVDEVRRALPKSKRGAYTTVQTVLNRLAERGLAHRRRSGKAIRYAAAVSEADYVSGSLHETLGSASDEARRSALASLVGDLRPGEIEDLKSLASEIRERRSG